LPYCGTRCGAAAILPNQRPRLSAVARSTALGLPGTGTDAAAAGRGRIGAAESDACAGRSARRAALEAAHPRNG